MNRTTFKNYLINSVASGFLLLASVFTSFTVQAADFTWNCAFDFFENPACWGGATPGILDNALLDQAGTFAIRFDSTALNTWNTQHGLSETQITNNLLTVTNGNVTLRSNDITYNNYRLTGNISVDSGGILNIGDVIGAMHVTTDSSLRVGIIGTGALNISNASTLTSDSGTLGANASGIGTVTVTGVGSSWANSGSLFVGNEGTGTLLINSGASVSNTSSFLGTNAGSNGSVTVSGSGSSSSWTNTGSLNVGYMGVGTLDINTGAAVSSTVGFIGYGAGSDGTVTVSGSGSSWTNSGNLYLGNLGTGKLLLSDGGSAVIAGNIINGVGTSTLSMNGGILSVAGGVIDVDNFRVGFGYDADGSYTQSAGQSLIATNVDIGHQGGTGTATLSGAGSSWTVGDRLDIGRLGYGYLNIENGATVSSAWGYIALNQGDGTVTVTGAGSNWSISNDLILGGGDLISDSGIAILDITAGGSVTTAGNASLAKDAPSLGYETSTATVDGTGSNWSIGGSLDVGINGVGILNISNGGVVSSLGSSYIGKLSGSDGSVNLSGTSLPNEIAAWDVGGSLYIGGDESAAGSTANLVIGDYSAVTVANETFMHQGGMLHINGGSLITDTLNSVFGSSGTAVFDDGSLTVTSSGLSVGTGEIFGDQLTLGDAGSGSFSMTLGQNTLIDNGASITLNNNSNLTTSALINNGEVSGYGSVNSSVSGGVNSVFAASGGTLVLGDASSFSGFSTQGLIDVGADVMVLKTQQFARLGYQTNLSGGTLIAANGVSLEGANAIVGFGNVNASIAAQIGSTIYATGDLALGEANKFDGYFSQGNLVTNEHVVTINDKNEAVLGSLTTLGNATGAGTLQAANGMLLQEGNNLIGYGTVNGDFINQGHVEETSALPADQIEFTGNVSGAGDYAGNIMFSGTFNPGNSPALVSFEDIAFGVDSLLTIEIGGLLAGSQYDVLEGGDGSSALLAGTLEVDLYDLGSGIFSPTIGDSFDIFRADNIIGEFDLLTLALLGDGLDWQLDYLFDEFGTTDIVRLSVVSVSAVPVPASVWLFGSGLLLLLRTAQRKKIV